MWCSLSKHNTNWLNQITSKRKHCSCYITWSVCTSPCMGFPVSEITDLLPAMCDVCVVTLFFGCVGLSCYSSLRLNVRGQEELCGSLQNLPSVIRTTSKWYGHGCCMVCMQSDNKNCPESFVYMLRGTKALWVNLFTFNPVTKWPQPNVPNHEKITILWFNETKPFERSSKEQSLIFFSFWVRIICWLCFHLRTLCSLSTLVMLKCIQMLLRFWVWITPPA